MSEPLYLTEDDVRATLTIHDAVRLVEDAARALGEERADAKPRQRVYTENAVLQVLPAAYAGRMGHKTYSVARPRGARFWFSLFDATGTMLAIIEADLLGQLRTGAASGVATRALGRPNPRELGIIGSGWQARSQLTAVVAACPTIARVRAWSRDRERLERYCSESAAAAGIEVVPVATAREAVADADVVCTMTSATTPVLEGAWLREGTHVNAAGSNRANAQEIDVETVRRAAVVAVELLEQAKIESGDLRAANEAGAWAWKDAVRLGDVVAGKALARTGDEQITLFESLGIGLWDLVAAGHVYDACVAQARGRRLAFPG